MNLVICHTPLQVLIFENIYKNYYKDQPFHSIAYFDVLSEKNLFYFSRLKKYSDKHIDIIIRSGFPFLFKILTNRFSNLFKKYDKVFVASIDSVLVHSILSAISFNELITFDDGVANIFEDSMLFNDKRNFKEKIVNSLLCKYDLDKLKKISRKHYTIFNARNIVDNLELISIMDQSSFNYSNMISNSINILLGQPLYNDNSKNIELFSKIILEKNIDYYFPHPRENYILENIEYIYTNLIFEEYIKTILHKYKQINIYTIYSSAVFSVKDIKNISVYCVKVDGFEKQQKLMEKFSFPMIG